jgi:DNA-binding CsgD family transcriptional regulator
MIRAEIVMLQQELFSFDVPRSLAYGDRAVEEAKRLGESTLLVAALTNRGIAKMMGGGGDPHPDLVAAAELTSKLAAPTLPIGFEPATWIAATEAFGGRFEQARAPLESMLGRAIEAGDETSRCQLLAFLHEVDVKAGNWHSARALIDEAVEVADLIGCTTAQGLNRHWLGRLQAHQGEIEEARATIVEGRRIAERVGDRLAEAGHLAALCFLSFSLDDWEEAVGYADEVRRILPDGWEPPSWLPFMTDEVEALIALGRTSEAEGLIASLERRGRNEDRLELRVWGLRGRALLWAQTGELGEALASVDRALAEPELSTLPFELARTLLVRGRVERRGGHKRAARAALEAAAALFEQLGAPIWAEKARAEFGRLGLRRAPDELTETERLVAELAAAGKKNREIATELFISRRTVEANLARAYRKLHVTSRVELVALLGAKAEAAPRV